ncbi:MAG: glycosyltransferase [Cyanobacteria bacterium J06621_11]
MSERMEDIRNNNKKKPRVAFVVSRFPVLSETFVINQATGLLDRGYEVDIFTEQLEQPSHKMHADVEKYDLLSRTHVFPSVSDNYFVRLIQGLLLILRYFPRYPKRVLQSLNVARFGVNAASLWMLFTAAATWESPDDLSNDLPDYESDYEIIHCQFGDLGFRGVLLRDLMQSRSSRQAQLIVMFRGFDVSAKLRSQSALIYAALFEQADFFLTNCDFFRRRLVALGCPLDRVRVHYSGLDCDKFPFKARQLGAQESVRIAATGRLVEKKGFEYCIRAVAEMTERYPDIRLDIIGDGPLRESLEALMESLSVADNVFLLGWQNEAGIVEVLSQAHLFVAPSVTAADGNQDAPINVLKEAMAMGLPVVSTTHGGIPELVEDGVSGYLVPERDGDAIAQALTKLIEHPQRWPVMGRAGRAYVKRHYSLDDLNNRLATLYEQLVTDSGDSTGDNSGHQLSNTQTSEAQMSKAQIPEARTSEAQMSNV